MALFVEWFTSRGNVAYRQAYGEAIMAVSDLLDATRDLVDVNSPAIAGRNDPRCEAARYHAGPPLSDDDLITVARAPQLWESDRFEAFVTVIQETTDPLRFPWLFVEPKRVPTAEERDLAVKWTAGLVAARRASTLRRSEPSRRQERQVDNALATASPKFSKIKARPVTSMRDLRPGAYSGQSKVAGTRADLAIALLDGQRLLALECKVSNSEVNSYKRLNHEVGNKRRAWQQAFGDPCLTGAVLAGSFSVETLVAAQEAGIYLFWEHDLNSLVEFVKITASG